jgi:DNA-binding MarR family transcriptional regulator
MEEQKGIFGELFLLSNRLQAAGDRVLSGEITISQWLLLMAVLQFPYLSPTIGETADIMGSSRQNVKKLALNLRQRGFLEIQRDPEDHRVYRLVLTVEGIAFLKRRQQEIISFIMNLFSDFSRDELDLLHDCMRKLYESILKAEERLKEEVY